MSTKVLLAYDGSEEGRRALREGARIAQLCGAEVFLFAVVNLSTGMMLAEGAAAGAAGLEEEAYQEVLDEGVRRLQGMGFSPTARLGFGDPAEQIGSVAKEIGADLVVVGHRQQGALSRWWSRVRSRRVHGPHRLQPARQPQRHLRRAVLWADAAAEPRSS